MRVRKKRLAGIQLNWLPQEASSEWYQPEVISFWEEIKTSFCLEGVIVAVAFAIFCTFFPSLVLKCHDCVCVEQLWETASVGDSVQTATGWIRETLPRALVFFNEMKINIHVAFGTPQWRITSWVFIGAQILKMNVTEVFKKYIFYLKYKCDMPTLEYSVLCVMLWACSSPKNPTNKVTANM